MNIMRMILDGILFSPQADHIPSPEQQPHHHLTSINKWIEYGLWNNI